MRTTMVVAALVLLAGCTTPAETPDPVPSGQIDGAVLNHVLVPYANATVELLDTGETTQTTDLGGFSFFDVPIGFHTVKVEIPGAGVARQVVAVESEGDIARLILQIMPTFEDEPHDTVLSNTKVVRLAEPGTDCECSWRTQLLRGDAPVLPDAYEMLVAWDGQHPALGVAETHLEVEVRDDQGRLVLGPFGADDVERRDGLFFLEATVYKDDLPVGAESLTMYFTFDGENPLAHPDLRIERHVTLHFGDEHGPE